MERDRICEHVREVGPYFEEQLKTLYEHPIVGDVRGSHFMLCIEIVADKETKNLLPEHLDIANLIAQQCQSRGLFVRPIRNQVVLSPPLILTKEQIDTVVSILHESFTEIITVLSRKGIAIN